MKIALFIVIFIFVIGMLLQLPTIKINKGDVVSSNFFTYIRAGMYFLPAGTVISICTLQLALWVFRVIVAVVKVVWDFLPVG